ncbi:hypothetical protein CRYO30217_03303 [Parvicella tangerina]|uniref:Uncharacterized protein n=2 Tax=Parvicella tangerina TaxID=2829795 RepID=A0A916JQI6_9FLAO|nr:hypothetical protein CRYO30217_03303 [Parvicella tangerina]
MTITDNDLYTEKELIDLYIELSNISPIAEWNEESLSDNPPILVRFRAFKALFRAFYGQYNLELVKCFVDELPVKIFGDGLKRSLFDELYRQGKIKSDVKFEDVEPKLIEHYFLPHEFIKLKKILANLKDFSQASGKMYVDDASIIAHGIWEDIDPEKIVSIDLILKSLYNPDHKTFTKQELIEKYDFPDVDLTDIDAEWF